MEFIRKIQQYQGIMDSKKQYLRQKLKMGSKERSMITG